MSNFSSRGPPIRAVRTAILQRPEVKSFPSGPTIISQPPTNFSSSPPQQFTFGAANPILTPMFNFGNGGNDINAGFGGAPPSEEEKKKEFYPPAFDFPRTADQRGPQQQQRAELSERTAPTSGIEDPWKVINSLSTMNSQIKSKEQTLDYARAMFWLQVSLRSQGIATQVLDYFYYLFSRADPERMLQVYLFADLILNDDMRSAIFSHPQFQQIFAERLNTLLSPLIIESLNRGERIAKQTFEQEYASTLGFRGDEPGKPDLLGKRLQQFFDLLSSPISIRRTWPSQAASEPTFEAEEFFP